LSPTQKLPAGFILYVKKGERDNLHHLTVPEKLRIHDSDIMG